MRRGRANSAAVATLASTRAQHVATEAALRQARSERARAEDSIGQYEGINARIAAAEAAVHSAELDLSYCTCACAVHGPGGQHEYIKWRLRPGRRGGVHLGGYAHLVRRRQLPRDAATAHPCGGAGGSLSAVAAQQALPRHCRWARLGGAAGERHKRQRTAARRALA